MLCVCVLLCLFEGHYLCVCVGGSQGHTGGDRAVGVTGAGEGAVAIAMERRWMAEGRVRKRECLWTLRVALHTERERERETDRQREGDRDRERERQRQRARERETDREKGKTNY